MAELVAPVLTGRCPDCWQQILDIGLGFRGFRQIPVLDRQPAWGMKFRVIGVVFAILLSCLLGACGPSLGPARVAATATPIPAPSFPEPPTYTVQRGDVIREAVFTARLAPINEVALFFRADGHVATVLTRRGDTVKAGRLLAELDDSALQRSLDQAEHDLEVAMAQWQEAGQAHRDDLAKAKTRLQAAEAKLTLAEAELVRERVTALAQEVIKRAQLEKAQALNLAPEMTKAEAELAKARIDVQQAQSRYDAVAWRNDVAATAQAASLERATLDHQKALASYELAVQEAAAHGEELKVLEEQLRLAEAEVVRLARIGVDPELLEDMELARIEMDILERGVDPKYEREATAAQFKVAALRAQWEEKRLTAPFDGEVMMLSIGAGRSVEAYEPVLILGEPNSLEIRGQPPADLMVGLYEGQPVQVVPLIHPDYEFSGTIRQLPEPFGGGGQTLLGEADTMVHVQMGASSERLSDLVEAGDLVRVTAVVEERRNVLWLHPAAIRQFAGRKFVVLRDGTRRQRVDVTTGVETDERVEIVSGLSSGQIVEGQ